MENSNLSPPFSIQRNQTKRQQVGYHDPIGTVVVNVKPEPASPASVAKHGKQPPAKVLAEAFPGVVAMNAALQVDPQTMLVFLPGQVLL